MQSASLRYNRLDIFQAMEGARGFRATALKPRPLRSSSQVCRLSAIWQPCSVPSTGACQSTGAGSQGPVRAEAGLYQVLDGMESRQKMCQGSCIAMYGVPAIAWRPCMMCLDNCAWCRLQYAKISESVHMEHAHCAAVCWASWRQPLNINAGPQVTASIPFPSKADSQSLAHNPHSTDHRALTMHLPTLSFWPKEALAPMAGGSRDSRLAIAPAWGLRMG